MLDPIVAGLGIASYFIGRSWQSLAAVVYAALLGAIGMYLLLLSLGSRLSALTIFTLFLQMMAWAGICYGVAWINSRLRKAAK